MSANANGIKGKIRSLQSAADTHRSHVITIAETKGSAPKLRGYSPWMQKIRAGKEGGGVAIAVREDIAKCTQPVDDLEDHDQEVLWVQVNLNNRRKLFVGVYYGKQENEPRENIEKNTPN